MEDAPLRPPGAGLPPTRTSDAAVAAAAAQRRTTRAARPAELPASPELEEVARRLRADPTPFEFFQLVRLLERLMPDRRPVGGFGTPRDEVVRFAANPSPAFPASEVQSLTAAPDEGAPPRLTVNFLGLNGPSGVLPAEMTAFVVERSRARDDAMRDFLDIFNHRFVSLFYRAWEKYQFTVEYERGGDDALARRVADLIGLDARALGERLGADERALLAYAGLLAPHRRSAVALQQMLSDFFGVPVEVEQFVGGWFALDRDSQCELTDDESGPEAQLGLGAVVGDEVWDQQSRVRLRLGPLTREQYDAFLPSGREHGRLRALAHHFAGGEVDFELQLVMARDDVSGCVLGADGPGDAAPLGWGSWLRTRPMERDPDETILAL
ncbi:MAG TPA: type VI secretion system baseplate subunit TssG [Gemmatimonadaceae bacterium]|nr:type VI secretion system baseplate subunit TssG [Gemmatimonadaceae bacterium]